MEGTVVRVSALDVVDLNVAHDQYDSFADIHRPVLSIAEFKERRNLPLNEKCALVFYAKNAHLRDCDFIEIDRSILETIGFKNTISEQKDRHGNIKVDENGNPKLKDMRNDFSNAIKCLRSTVGFIEGDSFDNDNAHFVIQKVGKIQKGGVTAGTPENSLVQKFGVTMGTPNFRQSGAGGQNKQSLWIRMRALEHFIIMANTQNSFMIREYFIDMKRIMTEYNMYQKVYVSKYELSIKDTSIEQLNRMVVSLHEKSDAQMKQNEELLFKNDTLFT